MNHVQARVGERKGSGCSKPVIGVAGGIGSGKSLVARQFESLGCAVIDADALSHQVLQMDLVRDQVVKLLGQEVLGPDGTLDRRVIGQRVFADAKLLRKLEEIVHPKVHELRQALRQKYDQDPQVKAIVEDCPLLFEVGLDRECDVVVFVSARPGVRLERVKARRGWSEKELQEREKNQMGLDIKAQLADHVIENSEGQSQTLQQVRHVLLKILPE